MKWLTLSRWWRRVGVGLAAAVLAGCERPGGAAPSSGQQAPGVPVVVASVQTRDMPVEVHGVGEVQPYSTVTIKPRISGQIATVHFAEGQDVRQGELLFTIDPRPFEEALAQAQAMLAKDTALAENARVFARRQEELFGQQLTSANDYDQARFAAQAQQGVVAADKAVVENARLQLAYCYIRSPIDGRTGNYMVNQGNNIKLDDTSMLVINQIRPIYVSFSVPEQHLLRIGAAMAAGKPEVQAAISSDPPQTEKGKLSFIDNRVDSATGTVQLKATFENRDGRLWPGQFVRVVLVLSSERGAVVVPSVAIQTGQRGMFVFVVRDDSTVQTRLVNIERTQGDVGIVTQGLQPGEKVVIDGQLRLADGTRVTVKNGAGGNELAEGVTR